MMDKQSFKKAVGSALTDAGFKSKCQSWYLDGRDAIVVLGLQKSDFDEKYYFNFGAWLKTLGSAEYPPDNRCHIQARLTALFPGQAEMIDQACRVDSGSEDLVQLTELLR